MAATKAQACPSRLLIRLLGLAGVLAVGHAKAVDLPEDRAEALVHLYDGGGVKARGPAVLVRKSLADKVSLSASYYVDMVSNASIDVVTTASPYKETRKAWELGADYVYRDALITVSARDSSEPDYDAKSASVDVSQEVFGGLTTVSLGFTRGDDKVGRKDEGFFDKARHWQYRLGVTQVLSPRWIGALNFEQVSDDGFLGSAYRVARVFGAAVPERNPRTRTSRAFKLSSIHAWGDVSSVRTSYRYYYDTWGIRSHTLEVGGSRHFGERWLGDAFVRYYKQGHAVFYSDNATTETTYISRNRQLGSFNTIGVGAKASYSLKRVPGQYEIKLDASAERVRFDYSDFTDVRTGKKYSFDASVVQLLLSATY